MFVGWLVESEFNFNLRNYDLIQPQNGDFDSMQPQNGFE